MRDKLGVLGLLLGVGVVRLLKQEAVAGSERNLAHRIVTVEWHSEELAVAFNALEYAIGGAPAEQRRMSGGRVATGVSLAVDPKVCGGDELSLQLRRQDVSKPPQKLRWIVGEFRD